MAEYVIREHHRGRSLDRDPRRPLRHEPLDARADAAAARPARDHPRGRRRHGRRERPPALSPSLELSPDAPLARELDDARADGEIPRGDPVRLEEHDVLVGRAALHLARDDLLQLVHLQPVEHAAPRRARSGRPTRASTARSSRSRRTRRARARRCRAPAPRVVRADRADERAVAEPLAPKHRVLRGRDGDHDVLLGRLAMALAPARRRARAQNARQPLASGSRRRRARSPAGRRGCTRPGRRPASRSRSRPAACARAREVPRRDAPRRAGAELPQRVGLDHAPASSRARGRRGRRRTASRGPRVRLHPRVAELRVDARHDGELAPLERQPLPRPVVDRARREPAEDASTASSASAGVSSAATSCSVR